MLPWPQPTISFFFFFFFFFHRRFFIPPPHCQPTNQKAETIIHLQTSLHLQLPPPRTPSTPPASKSSSEIRTESTLPASPSHPAASTSDILCLFHTLDLPLQPDLYVALVKECTIQRDSASALRLHTHFTNSRSPSAVPVLLLDRLLLIPFGVDDANHHQLLQFPRVAMVSVLEACIYTKNKGLGKQLHGLLLKFSPTFADDLGSSLAIFDNGISHLPPQCDTDIPSGRNGLYVEALKLLYKMKAAAVENFFDDALNYTVGELNFKTLVDGLGAVFYQYPFNVPAYYALILRSLPVLEGLALNADPNFKVLAASYPDFAKRLLTYPNPYLRDALIELLFKDGRFRWKRLENLLVQGSEDRDFSARDALQRVLKLLLGEDGDFYRPLQILIRPFCSLYYRQSGWTCHWRSNATFDGCSPELVALGWWSNF
ncbi:Protein ACTIVITY OF BC1 COMPLEX KINASE 3, chloroplastic [Linum grandiflorum]